MDRVRMQFVFLFLLTSVVLLTCIAELVRIRLFTSTGCSISVYPNYNPKQFTTNKTKDIYHGKTIKGPSSVLPVTSSARMHNDINPMTNTEGKTITNYENRHAQIQLQRHQHLQKMCEKYHRDSSNIVEMISTKGAKWPGSLIVDDKHHLLYCSTPKVAGTSWKRVFNVLTGLTNSTDVGDGYFNVDMARNIRRLGSYEPLEIDHILRTYTKFMFARNPLSRLLSAFTNKLAPNSTDVRNRKEFRESVGEIIQQAYRPCTPKHKQHRQGSKSCEYDTTFHDFVRFLIDPRMEPFQYNVHWMSNYDTCLPCHINYDIIGKYESLLDDAKYVLQRANVDHLVSFPASEGNADTSTHSSSRERLLSSYKDLSIRELEALVRRFKMDFLLFDYPTISLQDFTRIIGVDSTS